MTQKKPGSYPKG